MNDVGKPCAGDSHARFDRGPLAKREPVTRRTRNLRPACGTERHTGQPAAYLTLPTTSGGHVRVLVDGELLVEQDVTVSQEFALDLDVTSKRRVTLQVTVPDVYQDTVNLMSLAVVDGRFAVG